MQHHRRHDLRHFHGQVVSGNLPRVIRIGGRPRKAQKFCHTAGVQRPPRTVADGAAHGAGVKARNALEGSVNVAQEGLLVGVHGVGKERGLRLNAVGIGGNHGVGFAFCQGLQGSDDVGSGGNESGEAF